ncbi:MAG: hypothetical protein A2Y25_05510 [Candidatus Melainabacteria bacterium GWF2_37_15]|nr:MAG: hypothetical protein A2Y25_05510 [Candidatus Melainabacteria bacterium GWF2_37_15]
MFLYDRFLITVKKKPDGVTIRLKGSDKLPSRYISSATNDSFIVTSIGDVKPPLRLSPLPDNQPTSFEYRILNGPNNTEKVVVAEKENGEMLDWEI